MSESKSVLITGGAGILGSTMVRRFLNEGHRVSFVDRDSDRVAALQGEFDGRADVRGYVTDITVRDAMDDLRAAIEAEHGPVEVLVNNAAAKSENFFEPFETFPLDEWREVMDANVTSAVVCSQVFGADMRRRRSGAIVNILSVYGIVAPDQRIYEGSEYLGRAINTPAIYSASKAALWGLTKYLAAYWGADGVRVNAVTPGGVFSGQNDAFVSRYSARVPLGRMASAEDISGAVSYLASDAASYVTGHNLVVDGGLTVW